MLECFNKHIPSLSQSTENVNEMLTEDRNRKTSLCIKIFKLLMYLSIALMVLFSPTGSLKKREREMLNLILC